jgi:hypothetical protein
MRTTPQAGARNLPDLARVPTGHFPTFEPCGRRASYVIIVVISRLLIPVSDVHEDVNVNINMNCNYLISQLDLTVHLLVYTSTTVA